MPPMVLYKIHTILSPQSPFDLILSKAYHMYETVKKSRTPIFIDATREIIIYIFIGDSKCYHHLFKQDHCKFRYDNVI